MPLFTTESIGEPDSTELPRAFEKSFIQIDTKELSWEDTALVYGYWAREAISNGYLDGAFDLIGRTELSWADEAAAYDAWAREGIIYGHIREVLYHLGQGSFFEGGDAMDCASVVSINFYLRETLDINLEDFTSHKGGWTLQLRGKVSRETLAGLHQLNALCCGIVLGIDGDYTDLENYCVATKPATTKRI